ncbi:protein Tob1-like [Littorina saxatilis]|uniref:Anti-proliferative protein domain-containing protein n=1 Tax=Littorina saxatilis TaxID=31220 RepID=A0AAN9BWA8_9CAEN
MHVEVSVAINFLISYLYNKLPRRRVDLFGDELEKGLKKKFEGHWYPDKPFKGSGYRCVRCNGENVDPVIMKAAKQAGLDLSEMKDYIPEEMTLWIDPSEVSYRISEKSPIKILYSDRHEDESCDTMDREVQAANHTFNPEALSFQPIDSLSSSLTNLSLSLSPSSPVPPGTWSTCVSPSSISPSLFTSNPIQGPAAAAVASCTPAPVAQPAAPLLVGKSATPKFTAATFAATKFGSTKLKSQAKRPTRLSPTELGNYFRQQQRTGFPSAPSPQRPRSLSPRDPRLEFLIDQQHRFYPQGSQLSPQGHQTFSQTLQQQQQQQQHHHQQQQLSFPPSPVSPNNNLPFPVGDFARHTPSPHLSPNPGMAAFPEMLPGPHAHGMLSPAGSLSPDGHKTFLDSLQQLNNMHGYPGHLQHLLVAN